MRLFLKINLNRKRKRMIALNMELFSNYYIVYLFTIFSVKTLLFRIERFSKIVYSERLKIGTQLKYKCQKSPF